jgi:hypothetical protein
MRDVSAQVRDMQPLPLFRPDGTADPAALLPGRGFGVFDRDIFDVTRPDGFTYRQRPMPSGPAGRVFVAERGSGTTRLFFVWVPPALADRIRDRSLTAPLNFHVVLHPPTYEAEYLAARPYWRGGTPQYVRLGIRYLCEDFKAVAHHLTAWPDADPNLVYVVPVADHPANFADLVSPDGLTAALAELAGFVSDRLAAQPPQFTDIGRIMLSVYSRSGDRLVALMNRLAPGSEFFTRRLTQINAFDINLGNTDKERLPALARLWKAVEQWAALNADARAFVYTAYRSHFEHCVRLPPAGRWAERSDVDLDSATQPSPGQSRGLASEAYAPQRRFGLVCLPVSFFRNYIPNTLPDGKTIVIVGNRTRGWQDAQYHDNGAHGHSLFLRGMLSHALAHAHPAFAAARTRTGTVPP